MIKQVQNVPLSRGQKRRLKRRVATALVTQQNRPTQNNNQQKQTTVGKALREVGSTVGGLFGLGNVGRAMGAGISRIFGQGDYLINNVNSNSLQSGAPAFNSLTSGFRVTHREYVRDITSSTSYASTTFSINPGVSASFPWLSAVAANFEEYRIRGMVVYLNSSSGSAVGSTNTALGIWGVVTQYDPSEPNFTNKQQAENYVGCQSASPSQSVIHGIECKPRSNVLDKMYVRTGPVVDTEDYKFYDWGKVTIFTSGSQAASVIGELWISYDIEFYKPRLPSGGVLAFSDFYYSTTPNSNNPFGTVAPNPVAGSNLGTVIVNNYPGTNLTQNSTLLFGQSLPVGLYLINVDVMAGSTIVSMPNIWKFTGSLSEYNLFNGRSYGNRLVTGNGFLSLGLVVYKSSVADGAAYFQMSGITGGDVNVSVSYIGGNYIQSSMISEKLSKDEISVLKQIIGKMKEELDASKAKEAHEKAMAMDGGGPSDMSLIMKEKDEHSVL